MSIQRLVATAATMACALMLVGGTGVANAQARHSSHRSFRYRQSQQWQAIHR